MTDFAFFQIFKNAQKKVKGKRKKCRFFKNGENVKKQRLFLTCFSAFLAKNGLEIRRGEQIFRPFQAKNPGFNKFSLVKDKITGIFSPENTLLTIFVEKSECSKGVFGVFRHFDVYYCQFDGKVCQFDKIVKFALPFTF